MTTLMPLHGWRTNFVSVTKCRHPANSGRFTASAERAITDVLTGDETILVLSDNIDCRWSTSIYEQSICVFPDGNHLISTNLHVIDTSLVGGQASVSRLYLEIRQTISVKIDLYHRMTIWIQDRIAR